MTQTVEGFSKLSKSEKIRWIATRFTQNPEQTEAVLRQYWNSDEQLQQLHDEFIENTISNFYLPLGVAPNFLVDGKIYALPMAIEESSVVAAASKAAKFWGSRGGFHTEILGTEKVGQVHFRYGGSPKKLQAFITEIMPVMMTDIEPITRNMEARGGGITGITLREKTAELPGYYQLHCTFETRDAMGANFINSCLESLAQTLMREAEKHPSMSSDTPGESRIEVLMSILSNYVPNCRVRAEVRCPVDELSEGNGMDGRRFAERMIQAIAVAECEPYRAVTHNKGVMNGIDALVIATGNDFRAVEAGVHAFAARSGQYGSLTHASLKGDEFRFWIEIPLALGTVGGLTRLHPLVKLALEILGNPDAETLMRLTAVAGLAQNFAALRSLVTVGIQQGHMKMHLLNILNQLGATADEKTALVDYFRKHTVSHSAAAEQLERLRKGA